MQISAPPWFSSTLARLTEQQDLDSTHMCELMHGLLSGKVGEVETASLLVALRTKGETAEELASAAAVLREYMTVVPHERTNLLDTCGTGGDGSSTFNISTATALVVASLGVPVVKHGNRAMSSKSGSADVLRQLGVAVELGPERAEQCLDEVGLTFCLAPQFHPAMRHVGPIRQRLGVRTLFNCLGPLVNPARAEYQLIGVGRPDWLERMAEALTRLETKHAYLVHGEDGLDEVTLAGITHVREVRNGAVLCHEWTPDDFRLEPCKLEDLRVDGPEASAAVIRSVLKGESGPASRIVQANAAAALLVCGQVSTLAEGVQKSAKALESGETAQLLQRWQNWTVNGNS